MVHEIENFYGVYLLYCLNPKHKGRTYVGFTVNPNRRIRQHNQGKTAGGAKKTHGKGPWEMVLIIHGFPNMISALRFEWAWTKPKMSRRLKHLPSKRKGEKVFDHAITVLCHMLSTGPWDRLPLTIRWLKQEYQRDLGMILDPPRHMAIEYGPVKTLKVKGLTNPEVTKSPSSCFCFLCHSSIKNALEENILCFGCKAVFHTICLAKEFLKSITDGSQLLPIEGFCPCCSLSVLWGDLVRFKRGCYQSETENYQSQEFSEEAFTKWSDVES